MAVTLTIKQVPEELARRLRARAAANHRSLQGELMSILHSAAGNNARAAEPDAPAYSAKRTAAKEVAAHGRRLTLQQLWERSRTLGGPTGSESTAIVRKLRDERHRR